VNSTTKNNVQQSTIDYQIIMRLQHSSGAYR